jgi:tetratricopeptide (TPR) repeat protein
MRRTLAALLLLAPAMAGAECAPPPDRTAERASLLRDLVEAPDPLRGELATAEVWRFWFRAPDAEAQLLLDRGGVRMREGDFAVAKAEFTALIGYCPAFAEGWNQRAFARFLKGDLDGSLADIAEVLAREPAHFGALAGQVQIFLKQGKPERADEALRAALAVNPWIGERAILRDGERI